jgi:hypothetical protein
VAALVAQTGRGALLAKVDESAYRLIPVHYQDRHLLVVKWEGQVYMYMYVDTMLLFGFRSAPKIFNAVADALIWYLHSSGIGGVEH